MSKRCQHFLQEKMRFCSFQCKAGFDRCGNHISGTGAAQRVPCPIDPRHTVLLREMDWHLPRCPKALQLQKQQTQPYYIPDCNAGNSDASHCESEWMAANGRSQNEECAADADTLKSAAQRIAYARSLGPEEFSALLARIQLAYDQVCKTTGGAAEAIPRECFSILETPAGQKLPTTQHVKAFTIKHARQQAAILGQMQQAGLLQKPRSTTFVEFGAGKGYLSCMLEESFGAAELVMVDCVSFRMTADRTLRRLGAKLLRPAEGASTAPSLSSGLATVSVDTSCSGGGSEAGGLLGFAVATCCHHRCTWKHYVGKTLFRSLGFSAADFQLISWMTGWALCGHGRPRERQSAASSSDDEDVPDGKAEQIDHASSMAAEGHAGAEQERGFEPSMSLPRERRQVIGAQCKRLIDAASAGYINFSWLSCLVTC
ncbi:hypothetical protein WJX75_000124 [Coccomyxa subellipsoidea]|uniref:tRNA:m(4)X modification enzyme TRM13 n=1 Tax=Coccomyxa subellipsoidea TaxID=248742 RepID=A0ABR2YBJ9_9CHLO